MLTVFRREPSCKIDAFQHNVKCTAAQSLIRGEGTKQMLKAALRFVTLRFPKAQVFEFADTSAINCSRGKTVSLIHHYFAKKGKTWYQAHFNAVPEGGNAVLAELRRHLEEPPTMLFDVFYDTYVRQSSSTIRKHKAAFKRAYESASSFKAFVSKLDEEYDCAIFYKWLEEYMDSVSPIRLSEIWWTIPRSEVAAWPKPVLTKVETTPMSGGTFKSLPRATKRGHF